MGALMGPVMSEFRGKMDGGDINKILMKKINVVSYFSPLKLFEYMATGSCILASKLKVYQNILTLKKLLISRRIILYSIFQEKNFQNYLLH